MALIHTDLGEGAAWRCSLQVCTAPASDCTCNINGAIGRFADSNLHVAPRCRCIADHTATIVAPAKQRPVSFEAAGMILPRADLLERAGRGNRLATIRVAAGVGCASAPAGQRTIGF